MSKWKRNIKKIEAKLFYHLLWTTLKLMIGSFPLGKKWGCATKERQFAMKLCSAPEGESPKPAIVFAGKGLVFEQEKREWHFEINIFFRCICLVDKSVALLWTETTLNWLFKNSRKISSFLLKRFRVASFLALEVGNFGTRRNCVVWNTGNSKSLATG